MIDIFIENGGLSLTLKLFQQMWAFDRSSYETIIVMRGNSSFLIDHSDMSKILGSIRFIETGASNHYRF
ncbi:hypothetical protein U27_02080 [Candidatus Vecturithrix granuli]|uniref:Uncharacterized protein n=1 Tax=Vecturithrix granuli TaxID=1499967 RepID=A0A0S6W6I4_VECG1|nr:hypothetical protein U27_02080 [Candidatus Vecturithrix granuli]